SAKVFRRHSDNLEDLTVQSDLAAQNRRVRREAAPPQSVAQNNDRVGSGRSVLLIEKGSSHGGFQTEDAEIVSRDQLSPDALGFASAQAQTGEQKICRDIREDLIVVA